MVEPVRIPALERERALDIFWKLHVMEVKPAFAEAVAGQESEMYAMSTAMLANPGTPVAEFVGLEQAAERLRDGCAASFARYDALLCPVLPLPANPYGAETFTIGGRTVPAGAHSLAATVALNVTGLPGLSMRFGTSGEGLPIGVQLMGSWLAESTVLHLAAMLEAASPVRDPWPAI